VCLNSQPFIALSDDANDPSYLIPGDFLCGAPFPSIPDPYFTNTQMNSLSRWQRLLRFNQQF